MLGVLGFLRDLRSEFVKRVRTRTRGARPYRGFPGCVNFCFIAGQYGNQRFWCGLSSVLRLSEDACLIHGFWYVLPCFWGLQGLSWPRFFWLSASFCLNPFILGDLLIFRNLKMDRTSAMALSWIAFCHSYLSLFLYYSQLCIICQSLRRLLWFLGASVLLSPLTHCLPDADSRSCCGILIFGSKLITRVEAVTHLNSKSINILYHRNVSLVLKLRTITFCFTWLFIICRIVFVSLLLFL